MVRIDYFSNFGKNLIYLLSVVNIFRNRIVICIVFIFIAIVTVIVIFSMFMFIFVTIIKLLLGFFQDLNRRQSSPSHLRTKPPKLGILDSGPHPSRRTASAPVAPVAVGAPSETLVPVLPVGEKSSTLNSPRGMHLKE